MRPPGRLKVKAGLRCSSRVLRTRDIAQASPAIKIGTSRKSTNFAHGWRGNTTDSVSRSALDTRPLPPCVADESDSRAREKRLTSLSICLRQNLIDLKP